MKKVVIALMVAATSAIALAQTTEPVPLHGHGKRAGLIASLSLTDAQKQQIKGIRTADREQNKQLYVDFRSKLQQYRALKKANDPSASDVKAQLQAMKPQVNAARKASREATLNVLTPDQRAQLKAVRHSRGFAQPRGLALRGAVAQRLNFTDAQKAQLKQLRATSSQDNAQLFADACAKRKELRSLTRANDPGASNVKAELEALRPQLEAARQQQRDAFLNVLTPDQRALIEQWKAERQSNRPSIR